MFSIHPNFKLYVCITFVFSSVNIFNFVQSVILLFGKELNNHINFSILTLSQKSLGFYVSAVQVFRKHCGKGEIACNEPFLLFPQCFGKGLRNHTTINPIGFCSGKRGSYVSLMYYAKQVINSLPEDKTLDWSKLNQTADNILKCI